MADLRKLSENCNFGVSLKIMLRDRLVCGMNENYIQQRLLAETHLNCKKALDIATSMELAAKSAADMQKHSSSMVNKVNIFILGKSCTNEKECTMHEK